MKKILLISLSALLLLSSLTACGSKSDGDSSENAYSRQLYNSEDSAVKNDEGDEEQTDETTENSNENSKEENKEKKDTDKKTSGNDSSKSNTFTVSANTSSKKHTSSTASVKPAESSRAASSESIITSRAESVVSSEVSSSEESDTLSSEDTEISIDTETDTEQTDETDTTVVADYFSESDLICTYKGINVKAGSDINVLIAQIGLPYNVDTEPNEDNEELVNKTYYFDGMEVKTNPNEDGSMDYIVSMKIDDESYKTVKGAKIGMDIEDVIEIYGEDYNITYDMWRYEIDGMILGFDTDGSFVTSINYIYEKQDNDNDNAE